ncbi:MAG TPA: CPBP family glutamic-type intramembrane protease [Gammaproteobacteria bacterium]
MVRRIKIYLQTNLLAGLRTSPFKAPLRAWLLLPFYAVIALAVGFGSELFQFEPLTSRMAFLLPFTLFVFPSLLEEAFFRGLLIPRDTADHGRKRIILAVGGSALFFVIWHPLGALTINPGASQIFLDPAFLLIVTALGITCGYGYVVSKSLWVPVLIHWLTVVAWVLLLGGRNLILEL